MTFITAFFFYWFQSKDKTMVALRAQHTVTEKTHAKTHTRFKFREQLHQLDHNCTAKTHLQIHNHMKREVFL